MAATSLCRAPQDSAVRLVSACLSPKPRLSPLVLTCRRPCASCFGMRTRRYHPSSARPACGSVARLSALIQRQLHLDSRKRLDVAMRPERIQEGDVRGHVLDLRIELGEAAV